MDKTELDEIMQFTSDAIKRLGWTKPFAKRFIESHYGCSHRLKMTDYQLTLFRDTLKRIIDRDIAYGLLVNENRRARRRRKLKVY